jgi:arylsulfatase A-like enzyme
MSTSALLRRTALASAALAAFALGLGASPASSQAPAPGTPSVLPRPDFHFPGSVGRTVFDSDPAQFPKPVKAPANAPNVLLIMIDDVGFGQWGTFGGSIPTPQLDRTAAEGLRYNRFHTTALCSPTRAALLTGRNHHLASFGVIVENTTGYDGYVGEIPRSTGTVAEVLRQNGYATAWFGKNHNSPTWVGNPIGPFDHWPTGWGFDYYYYGFNAGQVSQWQPLLYENHSVVPPSSDPNYYLTTDLTDRAIQWIRQAKALPGRPYFLYFATGATHAPHHAPKEWIDRFKGNFDQGWDKYREETFARQKQLGVIPADTKLTPRPKEIPAWDSLEPDQKKLFVRMMEVFAGFTAVTDHEVGRLLDSVRAMPGWDNTLVLYCVGDNGSSAEGGLTGTIDEVSYYDGFNWPWQASLKYMDELGGPKLHNHFPVGWAWAMNTPFQWTKQVASHFGGTRNPLIISWPARIKDKGVLRTQFHHVVDIAPTIYEAAGITAPYMLNGVAQEPIEGVSMGYTFDDAQAKGRRRTQYFELFANRGIYHDGWFAASLANVPWVPQTSAVDLDKLPWELYNIEQDFSQADNLAEKFPDKLRDLKDLWWAEAARNKVLPVDTTPLASRVDPEKAGRPNPVEGLTSITYLPGVKGLNEQETLQLRNRSFTLTADVDIPATGAEGMIFTLGGYTAGMGLYVQGGRLVFSYNFFVEQRSRIVSTEPLPSGRQTLRAEFAYDGGGMGKGATVSLYTGSKKIAEGRIARTVPVAFSSFEGVDVGHDYATPIDNTYKPPFKFTGDLKQVIVELKADDVTTGAR